MKEKTVKWSIILGLVLLIVGVLAGIPFGTAVTWASDHKELIVGNVIVLSAGCLLWRRTERLAKRQYLAIRNKQSQAAKDLLAAFEQHTVMTLQLQGWLDDLRLLELAYVEAAAGSDSDKASIIVSLYAKVVGEAELSAQALLFLIGTQRDTANRLLGSLLSSQNVEYAMVDAPAIQAELEPCSALLELLRLASRIILPVGSLAKSEIAERGKPGEEPTDALVHEAYERAAKVVLEEKRNLASQA